MVKSAKTPQETPKRKRDKPKPTPRPTPAPSPRPVPVPLEPAARLEDVPTARAPDARQAAPNGRIGFASPAPEPAESILWGSELEERTQEWLIPMRIPRARIVLIAGMTGSGKSLLLAALAASITRGRALVGSESWAPGRALIYSREEDPDLDIRPRLVGADADVSRVGLGDSTHARRTASLPMLPDKLSRLEHLITSHRISFVGMDPITSYLSEGISKGVEQHVREVLEPLITLARARDCTIAYTCHTKKGQESEAIHRIAGATTWADVPRHVVMMGRDPHDPAKRVMVAMKSQGCGPVPALEYVIEYGPTGIRMRFSAEMDVDADDLVGERDDKETQTTRQEARLLLRSLLEEGELPVSEVIAAGRAIDASGRTMRRAKRELGITHHIVTVAGARKIIWRKPENWPNS
jgi:putative DNA primase/helicase